MLVRINAIALNTFREAIRHRILYLLLIFAVAMISFAQILSLLTVGSEEKIIKDFGLATIDVFGVLTAVFIGIGLVYTLLAKPLHRFEFILGKFAGLAITLLVNTAIMTLWFFLVLLLKGAFDGTLAIAVLLLYFQFLLITAMAVLFSCLSTPILASVLTLALYVIGHLLWSLDLLAARLTIVDRERRYAGLGVPPDLVPVLAASSFAGLFETMIGEGGLSPKFTALVLAQYPKRLKKIGLSPERLDEKTMSAVLAAVAERRLYKEGVLPLLQSLLVTGKPIEDLLPGAETGMEIPTELGPIVRASWNRSSPRTRRASAGRWAF